MSKYVFFDSGIIRKPFAAYIAFVGIFAGVCTHVRYEVALLSKTYAAFFTQEAFFAGACGHVRYEVAIFISCIFGFWHITNEFFRSIIINSSALIWSRLGSNRVFAGHG